MSGHCPDCRTNPCWCEDLENSTRVDEFTEASIKKAAGEGRIDCSALEPASAPVEPVVMRAPILLNKNTVALLHIFHKHDHLEDIWMTDVPKYYEELHNVHEAAAKQLIEQLEGHWTPLFMKALEKEIQRRLNA